jgi:hypothetical protein
MHNEFIYLSTICLGLIIISWIFGLIVRLTLSPWTSRLPTWIGWMLRIVSLTTYSGSVYTWVFSFCPVGPSWSWSYGNWIYNYIWNQFLLPLTLWVRIPPRVRCTRFISDLQQVGGLLRMFSVTCSRSVVFCGCYQWLAAGRWSSADVPVTCSRSVVFCGCSQWLVAGRWSSADVPVSSNNSHRITEILLKVG